MLNYDTCKKLKDAGFPMPEEHKEGNYDTWTLKNTHGKAYYKTLSGEIIDIILFPGLSYSREYVYRPTLEELIEACGDGFSRLVQTFEPKGWEAKSTDLFERFNEIGNTPSEAVANLWLRLNEK